MAFNARFQQMSISGQKQQQSQHQVPLRQAHARPVMIMPGSGPQGGERTYINVTPVAVASRKHGGEVQLINTQGTKGPIARVPQMASADNTNKPNVPAVPRSQAVKRFVEPSYSTLLQLQNDLGTARQKKLGQQQQQQQQPIIRESPSRQSNAIYANIGGDYIYAEGLRSTDSQGSATEDELLGLAGASGGQDVRPNYYASPPSPVSSSYSELRQATRGTNGAHPLGGYLYQQQPRSQSASQAMGGPNYDSVYEPVLARNSQPPPLLSRQALIQHQQNQQVLSSDYFGTCSKCSGKIVGEGSGCSAMGKLYHIHCFRCYSCQCLLQGKPFYALDGKPFCEGDYLNTLEKCCKCTQPILDRILRATGKPYHPQCFTCLVCGQSLDGVPFTVDAMNQIHCIEDFHRKFAPRCSVCSEPIMPEPGLEETVRVVALDRSFHVKCYQCEDCGLLLSSGAEGHGCYPLDDHVLCKQCNTRRIQLLTQKI